MRNRTIVPALLAVLGALGAGCDQQSALPQAQSPLPPPAANSQLVRFTDPRSGFSTADVRDAQEEIIRFTTANELVWVEDGRTLSGYRVQGNTVVMDAPCGCWLVIRFGSANGERRAYVTADYVHDNPGTVVDLEIAGERLVVNRTSVFPPGTYKLFGVITEQTPKGLIPLEDAGVWHLNEEGSGWDVGKTDRTGFYEIRGLYSATRDVAVIKEGFDTTRTAVTMDGDTRFDAQLVRR